MAIGLLGAGTSADGVGTTIYTVPSGISHAVVHITAAAPGVPSTQGAGANVYVNNNVILSTDLSSVGNGIFASPASVSAMLNPGDQVRVVNIYSVAAGASPAYATVSGYEVP